MQATKEVDADLVGIEEEVPEIQKSGSVKNGCRDRWGNLRKNVGGRPKVRAGAVGVAELFGGKKPEVAK